jgi:hypothetical protein
MLAIVIDPDPLSELLLGKPSCFAEVSSILPFIFSEQGIDALTVWFNDMREESLGLNEFHFTSFFLHFTDLPDHRILDIFDFFDFERRSELSISDFYAATTLIISASANSLSFWLFQFGAKLFPRISRAFLVERRPHVFFSLASILDFPSHCCQSLLFQLPPMDPSSVEDFLLFYHALFESFSVVEQSDIGVLAFALDQLDVELFDSPVSPLDTATNADQESRACTIM